MAAKTRAAPPGQKFIYNTADADLAGAVLSRATERSLSEYLTESVWQPFGMESDAHWLMLRGERLEHGDCCLSATLRDCARIGLFALRDGASRDGARLLPEGWMAESTHPSPAFPGYGYYWWLRKGGGYFASGSCGQHIEVDPAARMVGAIQSYWPAAYSDELISHNAAFVAALDRRASLMTGFDSSTRIQCHAAARSQLQRTSGEERAAANNRLGGRDLVGDLSAGRG